jgi:hypothetical protein
VAATSIAAGETVAATNRQGIQGTFGEIMINREFANRLYQMANPPFANIEHLHTIAPLAGEAKQVARGLVAELGADNFRQAIETLPHIDRHDTPQNLHGQRQIQHAASLRPAVASSGQSWASSCISHVFANRSFKPLGHSISSGATML